MELFKDREIPPPSLRFEDTLGEQPGSLGCEPMPLKFEDPVVAPLTSVSSSASPFLLPAPFSVENTSNKNTYDSKNSCLGTILQKLKNKGQVTACTECPQCLSAVP